MGDAALRRLERGWAAGEHDLDVRMFVERMRRDLPLPVLGREAWTALWRRLPSDLDPRRALEGAWGAGNVVAGAQLVVERLRRGDRLARPDVEAWRLMWDWADVGDADPTWVTATLLTGSGSEVTRRWSWVARLDDGRLLHATGEHWCTHCGAGWFCSSEGAVRVVDLDELVVRLSDDEVQWLLVG